MVEDRNEAREEDDHGERRDCKAVGEGVRLVRPEQELGTFGRISKEVANSSRQRLDPGAAPARIEDQPGDERLQRERRADHPQSDRAAVRRQKDGDAEDNDDPGDAEQLAIHESPSPEARKNLYQTMPCVAAATASSSSSSACSGVVATRSWLRRCCDMKPLSVA